MLAKWKNHRLTVKFKLENIAAFEALFTQWNWESREEPTEVKFILTKKKTRNTFYFIISLNNEQQHGAERVNK